MAPTTITWKTGDTSAPLPPRAPGLPILGNALSLLENPMPFFLKMHREVGPIYRLEALVQRFTVMSGIDASLFLAQQGEEHFNSRTLFGGFAHEMGTENFLVAMDGPPHRHMRKVLRRGYSKQAIEPHISRLIDVTRESAGKWQVGQSVRVLPFMRRLITNQLGLAMARYWPDDDFDTLRDFVATMLNTTVVKLWPKAMLMTPAYRNGRERIMELARRVLASHRNGGSEGHPPDLIDDALVAKLEDGSKLPEEDLIAIAIGPFVAGMDTVASTVSFMVYAMLKYPGVLERVTAEADTYFADGKAPGLHEFQSLKALYGLTMETLRMYPVTPFTPRAAEKSFEFAGYRVDKGTEVMIINGLPHFLPEYFPEPLKFDIDRYSDPRAEHRQGQGVFAPYTLGAHTCLGAGIAEVQLITTIASLLRTVRLELDPPDYDVRIMMTPIPSPHQSFRVRVLEKRE